MLENELDWPELSAMTGEDRIHVFYVVKSSREVYDNAVLAHLLHNTMKVFLLVDTNFRGFYKMH